MKVGIRAAACLEPTLLIWSLADHLPQNHLQNVFRMQILKTKPGAENGDLWEGPDLEPAFQIIFTYTVVWEELPQVLDLNFSTSGIPKFRRVNFPGVVA